MPNRFFDIMVLYPEAAIANRARLNANKVFKRLSTMRAWERGHPCLPLLAKRLQAVDACAPRLDSIAAALSGL
jgi:hypothetical protein